MKKIYPWGVKVLGHETLLVAKEETDLIKAGLVLLRDSYIMMSRDKVTYGEVERTVIAAMAKRAGEMIDTLEEN